MRHALALLVLAASPAAYAQAGAHRGALQPSDPRLGDGEHVDTYTLDVRAGQTVQADLGSEAFDPYLLLVAPSGTTEAFNDDHEGSQARSQIRATVAESGRYRVLVTSYASGETGAYTLALRVAGAATLAATPAAPAGRRPAPTRPPAPAPARAPAVAGAPTEADVQAFVTRGAEMSATGIGTSPSSVSLTFHEIRFGASRPANLQDRYNGVTGPTMFPARVRYTSHLRWGARSTDTVETHYSYSFYVDAYGEWNALGHGPVR